MGNQQHLFGTNGIRGLANKDLTPETAVKIGYAIGTFFDKGRLIVGCDARTTGPILMNAVTAGLNSTGCTVLAAGMIPTPTLQFAVKCHRVEGGVIITASHNPPEYNGIKVVWKDGVETSQEQEQLIEQIYFSNKAKLSDWHNVGTISELPGTVEEYIEAIKKHVDAERIAKMGYHVVVDPANSVGSLAAPRLLREIGCKVTTINAIIDGTFPGRPPEPRPENLTNLAATVKELRADLGIAFDGDADRSVFVDENGRAHMGDRTFALVEKYFLKENPGLKVVTPVSSSTMIQDVADEFGGEIVWTKVGSVTVARTMMKVKAKLGGEENGGIFYGPHQPVRDGVMSAALILGIMARTEKRLSELLTELPRYFLAKGKVECAENLKQKTLKIVIDQTKGLKTSTLDGVKIWFQDKSAILIRPSGTEPVFRLYAEAKTSLKASRLLKEYSGKVQKAIRDSH